MARDAYLRGEQSIDHRVTARCLDRIADWLDLADSQTIARVYPELPETTDPKELATAWMWCALLISDMTEPGSDVLHKFADAIRLSYKEGSQ